MKKKLLLSLLVLPLLAGCNSATYTPKMVYPGIPEYPDKPGGGGSSGGDTPDERGEKNMTVNFYRCYSESDTPIYTMDWWSLYPLGECPSEATLTSNVDVPDPLYPVFLGYSEYPTSIDDSHIWNFASDYKQSNVLNLYGIWVSE